MKLENCTHESAIRLAELLPPNLPTDSYALHAELQQFAIVCHSDTKEELQTIEAVSSFAFKHSEIFPMVNRCYQVLLTAPVTVASNEHVQQSQVDFERHQDDNE